MEIIDDFDGYMAIREIPVNTDEEAKVLDGSFLKNPLFKKCQYRYITCNGKDLNYEIRTKDLFQRLDL